MTPLLRACAADVPPTSPTVPHLFQYFSIIIATWTRFLREAELCVVSQENAPAMAATTPERDDAK